MPGIRSVMPRRAASLVGMLVSMAILLVLVVIMSNALSKAMTGSSTAIQGSVASHEDRMFLIAIFQSMAAQAQDVLMDLRENGTVSRGWLGISMLPDEQAGDADGVVVQAVTADGPADAAGLMAGDVVTRFAGQDVDSTRTLSRLVGTRNAGDEVSVQVLRNGQARELAVELGELDEAALQAAAAPAQRQPQQRQQAQLPSRRSAPRTS